MAVRNIKEIHDRILANYGGSDQSALEIEDDLCRANAGASSAGSLTLMPPKAPIVEDSLGDGAVEQSIAAADSAPVIDETPAEITDDPPEEDRSETMRFMIWEIELGARIYKVPEYKLAELQDQPHADKLKFFDDLEKAKAEAEAIFQRVAAKRTAKGLPRSILEPILEDFKRWDEKTVPQYFL